MPRHAEIERPGVDVGPNVADWPMPWARVVRQPTHLTLTGHARGAKAVAAVPGSHGRTLLATGGADRTVRLWDPATGTPVCDP